MCPKWPYLYEICRENAIFAINFDFKKKANSRNFKKLVNDILWVLSFFSSKKGGGDPVKVMKMGYLREKCVKWEDIWS